MEIGLAFCRRTLATNPAAVSLLLALLLHSASGLPATHPLRPAVDEINESGPFIGLVMAYSAESDALRSSGEFIPSNHLPWLDLYGRRFHIGSIRDVNVIYVMSGRRRKFDSETKMANMLSFAAYNAPAEGKNLLSSVIFKSEDLFVDGKPMVEVFWLQMESQWYEIAKQLKVELQRCANESFCLPEDPKMVFGLKASTADVFVDNAAYRQFLFNEFGVSTVDQESSAVVQTAMASGIPVIVFRGVSDLAGGEATWSSSFLGDLACINALKVAVEFIGILGRRKTLSSS